MSEAWLDKACEHLEWPRLEAAVLARCRGESARRRGLEFARDREHAALLLRETREALALLERGERLPLSDLRDVEAHLGRLERQGALKASALADILVHAARTRACCARSSPRSARTRRRSTPRARPIPALDALETQLRDALEPDGTLSDRASPELRSLRTEIANLRERIVGRLQQLIERYEDVLSDRYFTLREGRYVIPVRRDAHERVPGIVHAHQPERREHLRRAARGARARQPAEDGRVRARARRRARAGRAVASACASTCRACAPRPTRSIASICATPARCSGASSAACVPELCDDERGARCAPRAIRCSCSPASPTVAERHRAARRPGAGDLGAERERQDGVAQDARPVRADGAPRPADRRRPKAAASASSSAC